MRSKKTPLCGNTSIQRPRIRRRGFTAFRARHRQRDEAQRIGENKCTRKEHRSIKTREKGSSEARVRERRGRRLFLGCCCWTSAPRGKLWRDAPTYLQEESKHRAVEWCDEQEGSWKRLVWSDNQSQGDAAAKTEMSDDDVPPETTTITPRRGGAGVINVDRSLAAQGHAAFWRDPAASSGP